MCAFVFALAWLCKHFPNRKISKNFTELVSGWCGKVNYSLFTFNPWWCVLNEALVHGYIFLLLTRSDNDVTEFVCSLIICKTLWKCFSSAPVLYQVPVLKNPSLVRTNKQDYKNDQRFVVSTCVPTDHMLDENTAISENNFMFFYVKVLR